MRHGQVVLQVLVHLLGDNDRRRVKWIGCNFVDDSACQNRSPRVQLPFERNLHPPDWMVLMVLRDSGYGEASVADSAPERKRLAFPLRSGIVVATMLWHRWLSRASVENVLRRASWR